MKITGRSESSGTALEQLDPAAPGQHQVEQHELGLLGADEAPKVVGRAGHHRGVARPRQRVAHEAQHARVVVDREDARGRSCGSAPERLPAGASPAPPGAAFRGARACGLAPRNPDCAPAPGSADPPGGAHAGRRRALREPRSSPVPGRVRRQGVQ